MSVLKESSIYVLGELIAKAIPFLLLPYLTRTLNADGFGSLSYYQSLIAFFSLFIGLNQWQALSRYYYSTGNKSINLILVSGHIYSLIVSIILIVISLIFLPFLLALLIILSATTQNLFTMEMALLQMDRKAKLYAFFQILSGLLSVALTLLIFNLWNASAENRLIAMLFSSIIVTSLIIINLLHKNHRRKKFTYNQYMSSIKYIIVFGAPLLIAGISSFTKTQFDKILIYQKFSTSDLGIYSAAYQISSIIIIVIAGLNTAITPYLFEHIKKKTIGLKTIKKTILLSFIIIPLPGLIAYSIPDSILILFVGEGYPNIKYYISFFAIIAMFEIPCLLIINYHLYYRKMKNIVFASIISTFFYILFIFLLSNHGIFYIPYAAIASNIIFIAYIYLFSLKDNEFP